LSKYISIYEIYCIQYNIFFDINIILVRHSLRSLQAVRYPIKHIFCACENSPQKQEYIPLLFT